MSNSSSIQANITYYRSLRCHDDQRFAENLQQLQQWRADRLKASFEDYFDDDASAALLHFFLEEVLPGVHLGELKKKKNITALIEKLFTGTDMLTTFLEFNTLTFSINERLATQLFEVMALDHIDIPSYVDACHQAGVLDDMEHQLELFEQFLVFLDEAIRDPVVIGGLKIAKIPSRLAGFKRLFKLTEYGYKFARKARDPQGILTTIVNHERQVIADIRSRATDVFCQAKTPAS